MRLLTDPRLFSFVIIGLNLAQAVRFLFLKRWWDAGYWLSAAALTSCVTFRYQR